ncbi:MAG: hypothetical protein M2R46_03225 [Verrucomicrobia subdivision 3 bacterium]|nr:hypothetical protein [Limisphaerales bacterium]
MIQASITWEAMSAACAVEVFGGVFVVWDCLVREWNRFQQAQQTCQDDLANRLASAFVRADLRIDECIATYGGCPQ